MSGTRIDLDATRNRQDFEKAKIVIQDGDKTDEPRAPSSTRDSGSAKVEILAGEQKRGSGTAIIVNEEGGIPNTMLSATGAPPSSTRLIADAIKESIKSARKSSTRVVKEFVPPSDEHRLPRLPRNENNKPPEPSANEKSGKEKVVEEEGEIDMMPKTDAEKHNYWKTRMQILKSKFPDVTIPKNCGDLNWSELRKIYYVEMDRVSITKNVEMYKMAMVVMFFVLEYAGTTYLKIDVKGFSVHSMRSLHRYERLLIELGEKNYSSFADNWPVEFRLGGMVLVSAVIYCIAKYIFKLTGQDMSDDFFDLFQNLGTASVEADLPPGVGMDAAMEGAKGADGGAQGLGGMLSGLMGALGGQGGGGLGNIFASMMGGGGGQAAAPSNQPPAKEGSRIRPPTYRKKKKTTPDK
uniref:Uncharacterized protein n=1 Tax=viral metagenome TaxID=1070528 RepID=A0A6C0CFT1_9ZZZZ